MLLRDLFSVMSDEQKVQVVFNLIDNIIGSKETLEEYLKDEVYEYTVINIKSDYDESLIVEVEYVN